MLDEADDEDTRMRQRWATLVEAPARSAGLPPPAVFAAGAPWANSSNANVMGEGNNDPAAMATATGTI